MDRSYGPRDPDFAPMATDLYDAFNSTGWEGDLAGALREAPFHAPPPDAGTASDWRPFFQDYLRDLPEDVRTKYGIRRT